MTRSDRGNFSIAFFRGSPRKVNQKCAVAHIIGGDRLVISVGIARTVADCRNFGFNCMGAGNRPVLMKSLQGVLRWRSKFPAVVRGGMSADVH